MYTSRENGADYSDFLGGKDAYMSQTKRQALDFVRSVELLLLDPMFVGRLTDRVGRVFPDGLRILEKYIDRPDLHRERLNRHSCDYALTLAEARAAIDQPSVLLTCEGAKIRHRSCGLALAQSGALSTLGGKGSPIFDVCKFDMQK